MRPTLATLRVILPLALTLAAAAPAPAQAGPLAYGHGTYTAENHETHDLTFAAVALPDGSAEGTCLVFEPSTSAYLRIRIESYLVAGGSLVLAGTIEQAVNTPPFIVIGATAFFAVRDGEPDLFTGIGFVPPQLGNLTAAQIVALIGPPPPVVFTPLLSGDIVRF